MRIYSHRLLPVAAMLLLSGNSIFAQTNNVTEQQDKIKQMAAQDVYTYVSQQAYELPWVPIPEADIAFKKRVWRDIDVREAENKVFSNDAANAQNTFASILIEGILDGKIKAYDPSVTNWTKELTRDEFMARIAPGKENKRFNPAQVTKYQIKEDWLFLRDKGTLTVRIIGISPIIKIIGIDGKVTEQSLFLLYYPDCRNYLAQHKALNNVRNWDEIFESRKFKSNIIKVNNLNGPLVYSK